VTNPYEISLNVLKSEASATGAKLSACKHKATGFAVDVGADVHASVTGAQAKVATTGMKTVDIGVNASAGVDTKGVQVRALNDSVKGVKGRVGAAVKTSATGVSVKAGNTDLAVVDAKLKAQIGAKAKGVGVQAATAKVANVQRCAYAKAEAEATGVNITAAKVAVAGEQTSAYAEAKGSQILTRERVHCHKCPHTPVHRILCAINSINCYQINGHPKSLWQCDYWWWLSGCRCWCIPGVIGIHNLIYYGNDVGDRIRSRTKILLIILSICKLEYTFYEVTLNNAEQNIW